MKRLVAALSAVLCSTLIATSAMAAVDFSYSSAQTKDMVRWSDSAESSGTRWHLTWDVNNSNISSTHRAAIRIYAGPGDYASALYVYSSYSTSYHNYYSGYGQGKKNTYIAGRLDNRDSGTLTVKGRFYN